MRKLNLLLAFILALLTPLTAARAQTEITIDSLRVDIWPEYDRPEALIIYRLFLPPDAALPVNLSLRIPAAVGNPFNVAVREIDGQLYTIGYTRKIEGEWALIQFTTPSTVVQFEYYDTQLIKDGSRRSYTYTWTGDYGVNSLAIQVQQPIGAENMRISPSLGSGIPNEDGLVYYDALVGSVPAGTIFSVNLEYTKSSDQLSAEQLQVQPAGPISEQTAGRRSLQDLLPWALGGFGLLLVGGGVWWYIQSGQPEPNGGKRRRHAAAPVQKGEEELEENAYCYQCGKRAAPGDVFCRACGTRLRVDKGELPSR